MTVAENVAFGLEMQGVAAGRARGARRADAGAGRPRRLRRPLSAPHVGRPAAARGAGPRARHPAAHAAARRAAVQPRRQAARGDADRAAPDPAHARHHHHPGHPRPVRGDGAVRPHRGDEPGPGRADRARRTRPTSGRPRRSSPSFLGKTNVLRGATVDGGPRASATALASRLAGARGLYASTIRPEKIAFARPARRRRSRGTVKTRIFQGNHWLYQVDTAAGLVDRDPPEHGRGRARRGRGRAARLARRRTWRCRPRTGHERA